VPVRHFKMWPFRYFGSVQLPHNDGSRGDFVLTWTFVIADCIRLQKIP
jgi:hypothetical protein